MARACSNSARAASRSLPIFIAASRMVATNLPPLLSAGDVPRTAAMATANFFCAYASNSASTCAGVLPSTFRNTPGVSMPSR